MPRKLIAALAPALLLTTGVAVAQEAAAPQGPETSIPFVDHGGIYTFESDRYGEGVWLQDRQRNWYYARFFTRCNDLPFAFHVGFETFGAGGSLDRGGTIIADRQQCKIASLVRSGPPPKKVKKAKS